MIEGLISLRKMFPEIHISGVATDDPTQKWTNPSKRIWRNLHSRKEELMIVDLAAKHNIPVWTDRVDSQEFYEKFKSDWCPDVCYMGVFGQKVPERIWSYPLHGFYNFHTCSGITWPSDEGGDPVRSIVNKGLRRGSIAMHQIDNHWDKGELIAFSDFFPVSGTENPFSIQKRSAPIAAKMMLWHLCTLLGISNDAIAPRFVSEKLSVPINNTAPIDLGFVTTA